MDDSTKPLTRILSNIEEKYTPRDVIELIRLNNKYDSFNDSQLKKMLFHCIVKLCKPFMVEGIVLIDEKWITTHTPLYVEHNSILSLDDYIKELSLRIAVGIPYYL